MSFPIEIIEHILRKCDGKTLLNAKMVNPEWNNIVEYLSKKTRIWEWCCKEEIPQKELIDYLEKYNENDDEKWLNLYKNWISWQNINDNIKCDIVLCPVELQRISCIASTGRYIAIGNEIGRVKIFTEGWELLYAARYLAVKVNKINFINFKGQNARPSDLCLVVAYPRALVINQLDCDIEDNQVVIHDVKLHSVYKNFICYEQLGGRITILKVTNSDGITQVEEKWFDRIYSPSNVSCMNIWNGVCTVLINKDVKIITYDKKLTSPVAGLEVKTKLKFTVTDNVLDYSAEIIRDDVIIMLVKDECERSEYIEFFILGENKHECSKKVFDVWEVFSAFITCIFVYGNTLVIGDDIGIVYFYHISSWKHFDINNYQKKLIIGKHPIVSIAAKEEKNERTFFIASSFSVHKVVGFSCSQF